MPGVLNSKGATKAHRQVDEHPSRSLLPLRCPSSTCPPLPKRGSLQQGRAQTGWARQVKTEGGLQTWTASSTSTWRGGAQPTRNAQGASGRSGSRNRETSRRQSPGTIGPLPEGRNQGNPSAPSAPSRRAEIGGVNDSSNSSSSNNPSPTSSGSSSTSGSVSNGDISTLTGTATRRVHYFGKPLELQNGRTRSQSRGWT